MKWERDVEGSYVFGQHPFGTVLHVNAQQSHIVRGWLDEALFIQAAGELIHHFSRLCIAANGEARMRCGKLGLRVE